MSNKYMSLLISYKQLVNIIRLNSLISHIFCSQLIEIHSFENRYLYLDL